MVRSEREFLQLLEQRAVEEKEVVASGILPEWAARLGEWLAINPWRSLIPVSILIYLLLRVVVGGGLVEVVLAIFGGFRW
ncbi:MAG: hypothetical protein WCL07_02985 [bacterium]